MDAFSAARPQAEGPRASMRSRFWRGVMAVPKVRSRIVRCEEPAPDPAPEAPAPPGRPPASKPEDEPANQYENFSKEWRQASEQDNWDGFRVEASNSVNEYMQASHSLYLGTQLRECGYIYQFGPQFMSKDGRTVLFGRFGLDRGVNGRVIQKIGESSELKINSNSHLKDDQRNMHELSFETAGKSWAGGFKLLYQGAPLLNLALTQKIVPEFSVGGDLLLIPVNGVVSIGNLGARYAKGSDILTANITRSPDQKTGGTSHEVKVNYLHKLSHRLSLGTEYKFSYPDKESGLNMAYEYSFSSARIQGGIDTDGKVSCYVQDASNFAFSGMIDYMRGNYKFGVAMHVQPSPPEGQPPM